MEVSRDLVKWLINWKTWMGIFTQPSSAIWLGQGNWVAPGAQTLLSSYRRPAVVNNFRPTDCSNHFSRSNMLQNCVRNYSDIVALSKYKGRVLIKDQGDLLAALAGFTPKFTAAITIYLFFSWFTFPLGERQMLTGQIELFCKAGRTERDWGLIVVQSFFSA